MKKEFEDLHNIDLLKQLDAERKKGERDEKLFRRMVGELVRRGVYPERPREGNPNSTLAMVDGWGAYWHVWAWPLHCPMCQADWRDHKTGPPFKREIGIVDPYRDRCVAYRCPDCKTTFNSKVVGK